MHFEATLAELLSFEDSMFKHKPSLEVGQDRTTLPTYTVPEAASFLAIQPFTLSDWYSGADPLLKSSGAYLDKFPLLSFRDLDEAYKVQLLRNKHQYSLQYIRKALIDARDESGSDHPLLTHKFIAFDHLAILKRGSRWKKRLAIPLGVDRSEPLYIPEVLDTWGHRIVEDRKGVTKQIFPWRYAKDDEVSKPVSLDPDVMSGRLVVTGTRIPVSILLKRSYTEPIEQIAKDYSITQDMVKKAIAHVNEQKMAA